jgi:hypothetical protein
MSRNQAILIEFFWDSIFFGFFPFSKSFCDLKKNQIIKISRNSRNKNGKGWILVVKGHNLGGCFFMGEVSPKRKKKKKKTRNL